MKRIILIGALALASCVAKRVPTPPAPPPRTATPPAPLTPPPIAWEDRPRTPGEWRYVRSGAQTSAAYLVGNADSGVSEEFLAVCDVGARQVRLAVSKATARTMTVRTGTTARVMSLANGTIGEDAYRVAVLPATDALLDAMIFSRGKFLVAVDGQPDLLIPAWPELARTVEDCRG